MGINGVCKFLMVFLDYMTIPITVASAERFFQIKLIKSYLRTTMTQDRLNGLALLSIEKHMLKDIDVDHIIEDFALKNFQKSHFR